MLFVTTRTSSMLGTRDITLDNKKTGKFIFAGADRYSLLRTAVFSISEYVLSK